MKGSLKDKLTKFLMYFQRYLMTKSTIPMHIEFTLLDTFDMLESCGREIALETYLKTKSRNERDVKMKTSNKKNNKKGDDTKDTTTMDIADGSEDAILSSLVFPRYDSMAEVEAAIRQYEDAQSLLVAVDSDGDESDVDEDRGEGAGRPGKAGRTGEEGELAGNGDDEDDGSDDSSNSDDEEGSEDSDEEEEEDDESISDQHAAKILRENQQRAQEEDIDFERIFKTLVQHSVESVKALSNVKATMDINRMAIPGLYYTLAL